MTAFHLAAGLALLAAAGHSILCERIYLSPLRSETITGATFSADSGKRLVTAMFHLASICWAGMAIGVLVLDPEARGASTTLHMVAAIFALSGLGNFWAVGRVHPGGVILLSAAGLVLVGLHA